MKNGPILAIIAVSGLFGLSKPEAAIAACAPDPASSGATVNCTGTDANGFTATTDNLDINVAAGATVSNAAGDAIVVSNGNDIVNNGTIDAKDTAIRADSLSSVFAQNNNITNSATGIIKAGDDGIYLWGPGQDGAQQTVINHGLIQVGGTAIFAVSNTDVINTGVIEGDYGIDSNIGGGTVTNSGRVTTTSSAIAGSVIVNEATGVVQSGGIALYGGDVVNRGSVTGNWGIATGSDSTVSNYGTVHAEQNGIDANFFNVIDNQGSIEAGFYGVFVESDNVITNSGSIESGRYGIWGKFRVAIDNSDLISGDWEGIRLLDSGEVHNTGDIIGADFGINAGAETIIDNEGSITAQGTAILVTDGSNVSNELDVTATAVTGVGIRAGNENRISNRGTIEAGATGIAVGDDNIVSNEGAIEVGAGGVGVLAGEGNSIRNVGTIVSGGDGVVMGTGSGFQNQGEGSAVIAAGDALRIDGGASALILNSGILRGETAIRGGSGIQSINSTGVLDGNVLLGGGDDTLQLQYNAVVDGDIDGGDGIDRIRTTSGFVTIDGKVTNVEILTVTSLGLIMNAAAGSQIGATTIEDGALTLNGQLATDAEVSSAGSLGGSAAITGTVLNNGTVTPGNSIGTLTIDGDYTQGATGDLLVELGATSADRLAVTGVAALDGTLSTGLVGTNLAALEGKSYSVLTAGSISGGLDMTGTIQEGFWTVNVQQSGNEVTVTVTDVDVTIGATAPVTGALAAAITAAAPASSQGIVIEGVSNTLDVMDTNDQTATSLDYDSLGDWESTAPTFVAGWNEMGSRTPAGAMPKTGSAEFEGTTKGELTETASPEVFVVEGNVLLTANFASGLVNADFTEMEKVDSNGVTSAWVDFRARMSIADGTSEFAGTAGTDDGVWNGKARGGFYGDEGGMPGHAAGMWSISSPLGTALGGFMARRK